MSDSYEHNPGDHEDPLAGPTWVVGIAGFALVAVCALGVAALMYGVFDREVEIKVDDQPVIAREIVRAEQHARLEGPPRREIRTENPDGEESLVIPIEEAMSIVVAEAAGG